MKTVIIYGQSHKGSTYNIGRMLVDKIGGQVTEFFLPKDFEGTCVGCATCIIKDENKCPHHQQLEPITKALDEADVIVLASPVYVYHVTGAMKSFLDHYGYMWMVHRPKQSMFGKQAVCISTAAGAGTKSTIKDMYDSLRFWGIPKTYKLGINVRAISYSGVSQKTKDVIDRKTTIIAKKVVKHNGKVKPGIWTKGFFAIMRKMQTGLSWNPADKEYWTEKGWDKKNRPWK